MMGLHVCHDGYPDFNIDVQYEQKLLLKYDIIILQHPLYWYSVPPLMKQYFDMVLEHGWAYGKGAAALRGKWLLNALSTGGDFEAYTASGKHKCSIHDFLLPIKQMASLCHMEYLPPFVFHGRFKANQAAIDFSTNQYLKLLHAVVADDFQAESSDTCAYLNDLFPHSA